MEELDARGMAEVPICVHFSPTSCTYLCLLSPRTQLDKAGF